MRRADLVVTIGADQQQMPQVGPGQQILEQVQHGRIEPLQVVEEQRQRMIRPGEDPDEAANDELEAALRVLGRNLRDRQLLADDQLQFGNQIDDELAERVERGTEGVTPGRQIGIAFRKQLPDQTLKSLGERRVRDVALVLVELAGGEQPADSEPAPCATRGRRRTCRCRNIRRPGPAPAHRS